MIAGRSPLTLAAAIGCVAFALLATSWYTGFTPTAYTGDLLAPAPLAQSSSAVGPIVFALVMMGEASAIEGANAIKSALMHLSRPAEFHIICTQEGLPILQSRFALISRPLNDVRVKFYPVDDEVVKARATRSGIGTVYYAGWGGMLKVFMYDMLVDVEKAIFFDTDMMFLVDPYILWRQFDTMTEGQIISFPTVGPKSDAALICSCVMLLKFSEMRKRHFMSSTLLSDDENALALGNAQTWKEVDMDTAAPWFGDQGVYWAIWKRYPQHFKHLSESWDISECRGHWNVKLERGDDTMTEVQQIKDSLDANDFYKNAPEPFPQIFPGIVHFNCRGDPIVWESEEVRNNLSWGPYATIIALYKWVWLNRGDGSATVMTTVVDSFTWYDELVSKRL